MTETNHQYIFLKEKAYWKENWMQPRCEGDKTMTGFRVGKHESGAQSTMI